MTSRLRATSSGKDDQTWVMQGSVPLEDVETALDLSEIPADMRRGVRTLGGFVMTVLGRVPPVGDVVEWDGLRARVDAMDGRRIDRVVATKLAQIPPNDMTTTTTAATDVTGPDG